MLCVWGWKNKGSFGMTDVTPEFIHEHWTSCLWHILLLELGEMKKRLPSKGTSFLAATSEENADCTNSERTNTGPQIMNPY